MFMFIYLFIYVFITYYSFIHLFLYFFIYIYLLIGELYREVSKLINNNKFINDYIFKMLANKLYNVTMSQYAIVAWKLKYNISTIKPSYSRIAKNTPFNEWY